MRSTHPSRASLLLWHLAALAMLGLLLPQLRFHMPLWELKPNIRGPFLLVLAGYALAAAVPGMFALLRRTPSLDHVVLSITTIFGVIAFHFLSTIASFHVDFSPKLIVLIGAAALTLVPLGLYVPRLRWIGTLVFGVAAAAGLGLGIHRAIAGERPPAPHHDSTVIRTSLYNVSVDSYANYIPAPAVWGGGVSRIGDEYLLATGDGFLYLFGWAKSSDQFSIRPLPYRVPVNGAEFAKDTTGGPWHKPRQSEALSEKGEEAASTVITWWFRTAGILVQDQGEHVRIFASHYYWKHDASCWVERVSMLDGARDALLAGDKSLRWRTIFESTPCLPIKGENSRRGTPFCGHFGGGRMVMRDPDTLLLTVGDFGFNGVASKQLISQDPSASYGKSILIHLSDDSSEMFTLGNRNPQGLYMDPAGRIWETEHGPQGGDELNVLKAGLNYGWPIVTYGVDYGSFGWPLNPKQGDHEGFEAPFYAWVPSIGVSNLVGVQRDLFPLWKGDLLVSSLANRRLFRLRVRNDRVTLAEPILIDRRIRDVAEGPDGRIVIWADDSNEILSLRPLTGSSSEVAFATYCSGCHRIGTGTSHRIGPDLWHVIGRKRGSAEGYPDYSMALRRAGGNWTEERIDQFIKDPQAAIPGTTMEFAGVADAAARAKIIEHLKTAESEDTS